MKIEPSLAAVRSQLEEHVDPKFRAFLQAEIPIREAALARARLDSPEYLQILEPLNKMYVTMNKQLGMICEMLDYPADQGMWDDCQPLTMLGHVYPGIELTDWYQYHLGAIMSGGSCHLATTIIIPSPKGH